MKKPFNTFRKRTLLLVLCSISCHIYGQENDKKESETNTNWIEEITSRVTPYGSIRLGAGFAEEGEIGISNNSPRVGLTFSHRLSQNEADNFNIIGRVEFGLNLTSRDDTVEFAVDADEGIAQVGDAVFTRIGYAGISYKEFSIIFGKNNSIYYSLAAGQVDNFLAFGGTGLGVWNISDGGVSGTGRANQVLQLNYKKEGLSLGAQAQVRDISVNSESIDTYGFGANYKLNGFVIGIAYNKVNDGVEDPEPNQAKDGDEAFITAASFEKNRFKVALSYGIFKNHHRTGDMFYDSKGIEFYSRYKFSTNKRWHVAAGFSSLKPDSGQNLGDFDTKFGIFEVAYNFKKSSHIFVSTKQDQSKNSFDDRRNQSIYGIGIRFNF
ncbi:porin [uncultured Psychroserpens sp.]|uniref:porin n=1 Tax=uncultured Psychroserpens sp. TaxID=255436 RepID=UPI002636E576|nr:porin [uncultured Psychroserpens sp.]